MSENFDIELLLGKDFIELDTFEREYILTKFTEDEFKAAQRLLKSAPTSFAEESIATFPSSKVKKLLLKSYKQQHKKSFALWDELHLVGLKRLSYGVSILIIGFVILLFLRKPDAQPIAQKPLESKKEGIKKTEPTVAQPAQTTAHRSHKALPVFTIKKRHKKIIHEVTLKDAPCYTLAIDSVISSVEYPLGLNTQIPEESIPGYNQP